MSSANTNIVDKFYNSLCTRVLPAIENLPTIINTPTFNDAVEETNRAVKELHAIACQYEETQDSNSSKDTYYDKKQHKWVTCPKTNFFSASAVPISFTINELIEYDRRLTKEEKKLVDQFMHLFVSLDKFIGIIIKQNFKNKIQQKQKLEEASKLLLEILGEFFALLSKKIKDEFDTRIYQGQFNNLKSVMSKKLFGASQTVREILTLDRNPDGTKRKDPQVRIDQKEAETKKRQKIARNKAKRAKTEKSRQRKLRRK